MTIALAFNCTDGFVMCTDSLESDGFSKTPVDKIWCYETQGADGWGIAIASAGEADFADGFTDNLKEIFTGEPYNKDWIMLTLRTSINAARVTYPDLGWEALFAIFGTQPLDRTLLRLGHKSKHLAPISRYEAIGMGSCLAKFLCANMYTLFMSVDEAAELAAFITLQCTEHVEGCDLPISLLSWKLGQKGWAPYHPSEAAKLVTKFSDGSLRASLLDYRKNKTPNLNRPFDYDELRRGGFVQYRMAAQTKPMRSISEKSESEK